MIKVLMIEDDSELAEILIDYLKKFNIFVKNYEDPFLGLSAINIDKFDLVILDLSLPAIDGLEVCKKIRETKDIPIIISSARSDTTDKVVALKLGADDYLPKPYDPIELEARIKSVLRRYTLPKKETEIFRVDENSMEVYKNGKNLKLTQAEYEILSFFIKKEGYVISREDIIDNVDVLQTEGSSLNVLINRIRSKIEDDTKNPKFIETVRGIGYKFKQ